MNFLEKDLEEIIYGADRELLDKKGLRIEGKLFRQLRIGNYGVADLVSVRRISPDTIRSGELLITVYGLKKDKIGTSAFLQAVGCAKGIDRYLSKRGIFSTIQIVLIGNEIDLNSTLCYLPDLLDTPGHLFPLCTSPFLVNYTYSYGINGIEFHVEERHELTNEGF